jgi:catechol 2,3-dioxygenase-like lactoylglutathione lyase family enzyme
MLHSLEKNTRRKMTTLRYLVKEVNSSIEFYTRFLGFELIEQMGPAFAIVAKGDLNLWLSGPQSSAARPMPDGRQPEAGGWNRFVVEVEDIESLVATLKSVGVVFRNNIITGPGGKQTVAEDPSGNPIEIFQPA